VERVCVTLNRAECIDRPEVARRYRDYHPLVDPTALEARALRGAISGRDRLRCGRADWRHGIHEDGVVSPLRAIDEVERVR